MKYEWRKILTQPRLCLLLTAVVLCNAVLFYWHSTDNSQGYTMAEVQQKYSEDVEAEMAALEQQLYQPDADTSAQLTEDTYQELALCRDVAERMAQSRNYDSYRAGIVNDASVKLKTGIMGSADSFAARTLQRGMETYAALAGTTPEVSFSGGTELFIGFHLTDALCLLFALIPALYLLTFEQGMGLSRLTRPTRHGHVRLYCRKFGAVTVLLTTGFVLLYGSNAVIVLSLLGPENAAKAIQSVYGFQGCPISLTLGAFLALFLLLKYLWALCCGTVLFFLCSLSSQPAVPVCLTAAGAGIAALLGGSTSWGALTCSLTRLAETETFFQGAIYLNWFGYPASRLIVAVCLMVFLTAFAFGGGMWIFCRVPATRAVRQTAGKVFSPGCHTSLLRHETYKLFFSSGGILVLAALLSAECLIAYRFIPNSTPYEQYYRSYSAQLEGQPSVEKSDYLAQEETRFAILDQKLSLFYEKLGDSAALSPDVREMQTQLEARRPFEKAKGQYENLLAGQSYLYQTLYEALFGAEGKQEVCLHTALYFLTVIVVLSRFFSMEKESGVLALQVTAGRQQAVVRRKAALSAIFIALAALGAWLPRHLTLFHAYGWPDGSAQANSAQALAGLSSAWTVNAVFLIFMAAELIFGVLAAAITALTAKQTGSSVLTMLLSLTIMLLPLGAALLLL